MQALSYARIAIAILSVCLMLGVAGLVSQAPDPSHAAAAIALSDVGAEGFVDAPAVPALSPWALLLLAGLLIGTSAIMLRGSSNDRLARTRNRS